MSLNVKVKMIGQTNLNLDEIINIQSIIFGNLENGNLELYRIIDKDKTKADLPYFMAPWQKIVDCKAEERGSFGKKTFLHFQFSQDKELELEVQEKIEPKSLLADYIAFKNSAEKAFPKGASERAVESLTKVTEALGEAFGKGLTRAKMFSKDLKDKVNKEREARQK